MPMLTMFLQAVMLIDVGVNAKADASLQLCSIIAPAAGKLQGELGASTKTVSALGASTLKFNPPNNWCATEVPHKQVTVSVRLPSD
jgi:hypothetical protein